MAQDLIAWAIVAGAAGYLTWKLGWQGRARPRRGPDVSVARLVRDTRRAKPPQAR